MSLGELKDHELLSQTKLLVQKERTLLTQVLEHLREVEHRRLYCDLKYGSLFDYCVKELKYSEGAAARRIQAMRLIREIPQVEKKIEEGRLSLSNLCQVQSYFREAQKLVPNKPITAREKLDLIEKVENQSARSAERILISLSPERAMPKEKARLITETVTEMSFLMDQNLKEQLAELRSLLGVQGANMGMTELISKMASISIEHMRAKKFGKKRVEQMRDRTQTITKHVLNSKINNEVAKIERDKRAPGNRHPDTPPPAALSQVCLGTPTVGVSEAPKASARSRYISKAEKLEVWERDGGKCQCCGSNHLLQFDHIWPFALGGDSTSENLRLLCFQCNQRAATRVFSKRVHPFR